MWVKVGPEALPLSVEVYSLCFDKEVKWSVYINNCSVLYKPVDVMLCSVFAVRHFEYTSHAEQGFLCIPVCHHLCGGRKRQTEHYTPGNGRAETRSDPCHLGPAPIPRQQRRVALRAWLRCHHRATGKASWVTGWNWLKGHYTDHSLCFRSPVGRLLPVFPAQELINATDICSIVTQPQ